MILSDLSVKRPTIAIVLNLLLVVFGIVAFTKVPLRQYPDIDPSVVSVATNYTGASADIVDTKITRVLEEQLNGIEGIKYINSVSRDGYSAITVEFELSRDVDAAVNDVQQSIGRALDKLPTEIDPPRVSKADTNAQPIMWFNLLSDTLSPLELSDYARRMIVDRLSVVDGVARVIVGSERRYAMRVYLDRKALAARGLTANDIESALLAENIELPAGKVESHTRDFAARINPIYRTADEFASLVVSRGEDGHLVRLGEVAKVMNGAENDENFFRREGRPLIGLGIVKQSQANTVDVARGAREAVAQINKTLPKGVMIEKSYDSSVYISSSINEVYNTLGIALILVVLVIYLFLGNVRATFVPAITVPISLIAAFIFVYAMGFTINILTLLALVLAIGLVVDDTIVVLENIFRRIEQGEPPLLAAYRGAREVGFAVVATTLVLISVFVPLIFLEGNVGRLFIEFALTLAAAVGFSSFVALTLSPVLSAKLLSKNQQASLLENMLRWVEARYEKVLKANGQHPGYSLVILVVAAVLITWLMVQVPKEFAPEEDSGGLIMIFQGPEGSSFERTRDTVLKIEEILLGNYDRWGLERVLLRVPSFLSGGEPTNSAVGILGLRPWEERDISALDVRQQMNQAFYQVPDGITFVIAYSGLTGAQTGQPVQVVVGADTYTELAEWRKILLARAEDYPVLQNVNIDYVVNTQQLVINVDQQRAADLGVTIANVGRTLETLLGSRKVTTYLERGEEYDVILEGLASDITAPNDLENIYVRSDRTGKLIPLANVVTIDERAVSPALPRYNRRRALTLSAGIAPGFTLGQALEAVETLVRKELPATSSLDYKGESLEYVRAGGSVLFVFAVALLVAYLVMAAQFESFLHPLIIMMTVPLAILGALSGLLLTGQTLNIFSQIGLVMLIGLAAKNGILIVEFANQLRDKGLAFEEALIQAARQRLRPILMTSLTTMLGAVPLLMAFGAGAESRFVLGVVIFFGVLSATLLTLFVLPSLYLIMARRSNTPGRVAQKIRTLEQQ